MEAIFLVGSIWAAILIYVVVMRHGWPVSQTARRIDLVPREMVGPEQLSVYLLSANLALMEGDNFNQLGSSLSARRVARALERHWQITTRFSFERAMAAHHAQLRHAPTEIRDAMATWIARGSSRSHEFATLFHTCWFLSEEAGLIDTRQIDRRHLKLAAWNAQQLAYMIRLGHSAGYVSRKAALSQLDHLGRQMAMYYDSWEDFSISALIGMGVTEHYDTASARTWHRLARTHKVLMSRGHCLLELASLWQARIETDFQDLREAPQPMDWIPDTPDSRLDWQLAARAA